MYARGAVEEDLIVQQDAAFIGTHESGDGIEGQSFAGAARTEQDRHSGGGAEIRDPAKNRRNPVRRRTACESRAWIITLLVISCLARSERIRGETIRQRQNGERNGRDNDHQHASGGAVASFHGVVDRDGDGLGAARNVPGDHQRDAEIAQRSGKGERGGRQNGPPHQRQRHAPEQTAARWRPDCAPRVHRIDRRSRKRLAPTSPAAAWNEISEATTAACQVKTSGPPKSHS